MVKFHYEVEPSILFGEVFRPVARVQFKSTNRNHWFPTSMYVDSGADITLVPRRFGKLLGLDLGQNHYSLKGLAGRPIRVSIHRVKLKIANAKFDADVAVALREDVSYILGRAGVFRNHKITFEEYDLTTRFDPPRKKSVGANRRDFRLLAQDRLQNKIRNLRKIRKASQDIDHIRLKIGKVPGYDSTRIIREWRERRRS